jgi:hypothetical protein
MRCGSEIRLLKALSNLHSIHHHESSQETGFEAKNQHWTKQATPNEELKETKISYYTNLLVLEKKSHPFSTNVETLNFLEPQL